jgi:predicted nucleic acid-binding protein
LRPHLDAEVVSALRGMAPGQPWTRVGGSSSFDALALYPIRRMPLPPLLDRMWELRNNMTAYDAAYVALAERLEAVLVTCDARLATASGPNFTVDQIV